MALTDYAKRKICLALGSEKLGLTLAAKIDSAANLSDEERYRLQNVLGTPGSVAVETAVEADSALGALSLTKLHQVVGTPALTSINGELG